MTHQEARNLRRRKVLKGKEVGCALLESFLHDYRERDSESPTVLFTQQDLNQMLGAIRSDYERQVYSGYAKLYERIVVLYNQSQGMEQQVQYGLYRMSNQLSLMERLRSLEKAMQQCITLETSGLQRELEHLFPERLEFSLIHEEDRPRILREEVLYPAFLWLRGYNAVLLVLGELLGMPDLNLLTVDVELLLESGAFHDDTLARLREELRAEKEWLSALEQCYVPLELERRLPDPKATGALQAQWQVIEPGEWMLSWAVQWVMRPGERESNA